VSALLRQRPRLAKGGASDSETSDGDTSDSDQSDAGKESQSSSSKKEAKEVVTAESAPSIAPGTKDWSSMVVAEIKEECKRLNLKVTGKKADLIERIEQHMAAGGTAAALAQPSGPSAPQVPETPAAVEPSVAAPAARTDAAPGHFEDYEKYTISDLKEMLRSNKLKVSGKKADLIMRCVENNIAAS
jgi:hypothetical protein